MSYKFLLKQILRFDDIFLHEFLSKSPPAPKGGVHLKKFQIDSWNLNISSMYSPFGGRGAVKKLLHINRPYLNIF